MNLKKIYEIFSLTISQSILCQPDLCSSRDVVRLVGDNARDSNDCDKNRTKPHIDQKI